MIEKLYYTIWGWGTPPAEKEPDLSQLSQQNKELLERIVSAARFQLSNNTYKSGNIPCGKVDTTVILQFRQSKSWSHIKKLCDTVTGEPFSNQTAIEYAQLWKENAGLMLDVHRFTNHPLYAKIKQGSAVREESFIDSAALILNIVQKMQRNLKIKNDDIDDILNNLTDCIENNNTTELKEYLTDNIPIIVRNIIRELLSHGQTLLTKESEIREEIKKSPNCRDLYKYINDNWDTLRNGILLGDTLTEDKILVQAIDEKRSEKKDSHKGSVMLSFSNDGAKKNTTCELTYRSPKMEESLVNIVKTAIPVINYRLTYAYKTAERRTI